MYQFEKDIKVSKAIRDDDKQFDLMVGRLLESCDILNVEVIETGEKIYCCHNMPLHIRKKYSKQNAKTTP